MKKTGMVIGILLLAGMVAYPVFGYGPGWGRGYHMWGDSGGPGACWRDSGGEALSQDQRDKLNALDRKFYDDTQTLRDEIWSKNLEMDKLLNAEAPDEAKINSLQKEINTLRNQMAEKRLNYRLETRKIAPDGTYYGNEKRYSGRRGGGYRGNYGPGGGCWN